MPSTRAILALWIPILLLTSLCIYLARVYPAQPIQRSLTLSAEYTDQQNQFGSSQEAQQASGPEISNIESLELIEQRRMANSTESISNDSKSQLAISQHSFYISMVGIGAAVAALLLNWQATLAAQEQASTAREMGEAQVRAYISIQKIECKFAHIGDEYHLILKVFCKNTGQSPTINTYMGYELDIPEGIQHSANEIFPNIEAGSKKSAPLGFTEKSGIPLPNEWMSNCGNIKKQYLRFQVGIIALDVFKKKVWAIESFNAFFDQSSHSGLLLKVERVGATRWEHRDIEGLTGNYESDREYAH